MNDILPAEVALWQLVENTFREVLSSYCYQEIRVPIVEKTELFKRSIGETTDIVEKEMYTFLDRNNDSLTLRPEGTAGCVRAGIEHGLLYNQIQRLWYLGPYFRHERPQKGRYRQFYQCGVEAFGMEGPDIDAEIISVSSAMLDKMGLTPYVTLQINSLGSIAARTHYRETLVKYLTNHQNQLDEDSQRRLVSNPLRILDSKNPAMQELISNAPKLIDHLDTESEQHFNQLQIFLKNLNIRFKLNFNLVRGLDYYTKTVFEWVTDKLGSQSAVCSGGRYDGLVEQLGGKPTPAMGFALGMERLVLLVQQLQQPITMHPDIYFITDGDTAFQTGLKFANQLRNQLSGIRILLHCGGGNLKNQFKKADKSGAQFAFILGENELATHSIGVKNLRQDKPQETIAQDRIIEFLERNTL
jgi:histidyl-tRNA synthetase